jgi:hypothetical protein
MHPPTARCRDSWFRAPYGRRLTHEIAVVVLLKLAFLTVLYYFCVAPMVRRDATPIGTAEHLLAAPAANATDRHD